MRDRLEIGDFIPCIKENDVGFEVGKNYPILYGGMDCYSNVEKIVEADNGNRYYVYTQPFFEAFGEDPKPL